MVSRPGAIKLAAAHIVACWPGCVILSLCELPEIIACYRCGRSRGCALGEHFKGVDEKPLELTACVSGYRALPRQVWRGFGATYGSRSNLLKESSSDTELKAGDASSLERVARRRAVSRMSWKGFFLSIGINFKSENLCSTCRAVRGD